VGPVVVVRYACAPPTPSTSMMAHACPRWPARVGAHAACMPRPPSPAPTLPRACSGNLSIRRPHQACCLSSTPRPACCAAPLAAACRPHPSGMLPIVHTQARLLCCAPSGMLPVVHTQARLLCCAAGCCRAEGLDCASKASGPHLYPDPSCCAAGCCRAEGLDCASKAYLTLI